MQQQDLYAVSSESDVSYSDSESSSNNEVTARPKNEKQMKKKPKEDIQEQPDQSKQKLIESSQNIQKYSQNNSTQSTDSFDSKQNEILSLIDQLRQQCDESNITNLPYNEKLMRKLTHLQSQEGKKLTQKKVIALFGVTGAGKSTTINASLGVAKLVKTLDKNGKPVQMYVFDQEVAEVGKNNTNSQTLFAQCIKAPLNICGDNQEWYFADLPGTLDQRGFEVEITNQFMVSSTLQQCAQIKPIFVLNAKEFQVAKMESIKKTLKIVCSMIDIEKCRKEISVIITKADKYKNQMEAKCNFESYFIELKEHFEEQYKKLQLPEDKKVFLFLQEYVEQYTYNSPFFLYIDDENNPQLLQKFFANSNRVIENPKICIKSGELSQENYQKLKQYGDGIKQQVENLIKDVSTQNFDKIKEIQDDAYAILTNLKIPILKDSYIDALAIINDQVEEKLVQCNQILSNLQKTDFGNNITDKDLSPLVDIYEYLQIFDKSQLVVFLDNKKLQNTTQQIDEQLIKTCEIIVKKQNDLINKSDTESIQKACFQQFKLIALGQQQKSVIQYYDQGLGNLQKFVQNQYDLTLKITSKIFLKNTYTSPEEKTKINENFLELQKNIDSLELYQDYLKKGLKPEGEKGIQNQQQYQKMFQMQTSAFQVQITQNYDSIKYVEKINAQMETFIQQINQDFANQIETIQETLKQIQQEGQQKLQDQALSQNQQQNGDKVVFNSEEEQKKQEVNLEDLERNSDTYSEKTSLNFQRYQIPDKQYFILNKLSKNKYFEEKFPQTHICQKNDKKIFELLENIQTYLQKVLYENDKEDNMACVLDELKHELKVLKSLFNLVESKCEDEILMKYHEMQLRIGKCVSKVGKSINKTVDSFNDEDSQKKGKNLDLGKFFNKFVILKKLLWVDDLLGNNQKEVQNTIKKAEDTFGYFTEKLKDNFIDFHLEKFLKNINSKEDIEIQRNIMLNLQDIIDIESNLNSKKFDKGLLKNNNVKEQLQNTINEIYQQFDSQLSKTLSLLQSDILSGAINYKKGDLYLEVLTIYKQISKNFKSNKESIGFKSQITEFIEFYQEFFQQNYIRKIKEELKEFNIENIPIEKDNQMTLSYIPDFSRIKSYSQSSLQESNIFEKKIIEVSEKKSQKLSIYQIFDIWYKILVLLQKIQKNCYSMVAYLFEGSDIASEIQNDLQQNFLDKIFDNYHDYNKFDKESFYQYQQYLYQISKEFKKAFKNIDTLNIPELENPQAKLDTNVEQIINLVKNLAKFDLENEILEDSDLVKKLQLIKETNNEAYNTCIEKALFYFNHQLDQKVNNISKFRQWQKDIDKNMDSLNCLQPFIEFFTKFQIQHKIQDKIKLVSKEFNRQFKNMEDVIKKHIINLDFQMAYDNIQVLENIITCFHDKQINANFMPFDEYYQCEDKLWTEIFVKNIDEVLDQLKKQNKYLQDNYTRKFFRDYNQLIDLQLPNIVREKLSQLQSVYVKKCGDYQKTEFQKMKSTSSKPSTYEQQQNKIVTRLQEYCKQDLSFDDSLYIQEIINYINEDFSEFQDTQKNTMQIMSRNIFNLNDDELRAKYNSLNQGQKKQFSEDLELQFVSFIKYFENYSIEEPKYQNLEEINDKLNNFNRIIKSVFAIKNKEALMQKQQQDQLDVINSVLSKQAQIIKSVRQKIVKNKDFTYGTDLQNFITFVSGIHRIFFDNNVLKIEAYQQFAKLRDQIQQGIAQKLKEITELFDQKLNKDRTFIQVQKQLLEVQKMQPLYENLIEIRNEKKDFLHKDLQQSLLNFKRFEQCQEEILKYIKENMSIIEKELNNYNMAKIEECISKIQHINVLEPQFERQSSNIRNIINKKIMIQIVTDFQDKMFIKCEEMVQKENICQELEMQLRQLKVVDDTICKFPDTFKAYNPCQKQITNQLQKLSTKKYEFINKEIQTIFNTEEMVYQVKNADIDPIIIQMLQLYHIQDIIKQDTVQQNVKSLIEKLLFGINRKLEEEAFFQFGQRMVQKDAQLGQEIVHSFELFDLITTQGFVEKTHGQDENYTTKNFRFINTKSISTQLTRDVLQQFKPEFQERLLRQFVEIQKQYQISLNGYFSTKPDEIISELDLKNQILNKRDGIIKAQKENIVDEFLNDDNIVIGFIFGKLFALWSILDKKKRVNNSKGNQSQRSLRKPHPVQIISILIMLNLHKTPKNDNKWYNQMLKSGTFSSQIIEILTGQGKSITLGMTSLILALFGYQVEVACYSQYLSKRDYEDFKILFDFMEIDREDIFYGTYKDIIERFLNKKADIRSLGESYFTDKNKYLKIQQKSIEQQQKNEKQQKNKILLIDEVDQFFSKQIYGRSYNPSVGVSLPNLVPVMDYIWKNKDNSTVIQDVMQLPEYTALIEQNQNLKNIINAHLKKMKLCAKSIDKHYELHKPQVLNNKIAYKQFDSLSTDINYGYFTTFSYFKEHESDSTKISLQDLQSQCKLSIVLGNFSYAELPFDMKFENIMGVTGTLLDLDPKVFQYFKDYKIHKLNFAPSIYQTKPPSFQERSGIQVYQDQQTWFSNLYATTLKAQKDEQPSIIFFEKESELREYKTYLENEGKYDINTFQILTQDYEDQYETIIKNATKKGTITLANACFGRGVDFKCYDNSIDKRGGLLVVMAFISPEKVEDTQIRGRTGRNGQNGEIQYHLLQNSLEQSFQITEQNVKDWNDSNVLYKKIDECRTKKYSEGLQEQKKDVDRLKPLYAESQELLKGFLENNEQKIIQQIEKFN